MITKPDIPTSIVAVDDDLAPVVDLNDLDNSNDKPIEVSNDKPIVSNDKPIEISNDKPIEISNDKPIEISNDKPIAITKQPVNKNAKAIKQPKKKAMTKETNATVETSNLVECCLFTGLVDGQAKFTTVLMSREQYATLVNVRLYTGLVGGQATFSSMLMTSEQYTMIPKVSN